MNKLFFIVVILVILVVACPCLAEEPDGLLGRKALGMEALSLLEKQDYKSLEDMASQFRKKKERFSDGAWKLKSFYDGFEAPKSDTESQWLQHIKMIEQWQQQYPKSPTPRIALATAWAGYAWDARGTGYMMKPGGAEPFHERLARATDILADAALGELDPEADALKLMLAKATGLSREAFDRLLQAAISREPRYHSYYASAVDYYTEKWQGEPGEWINKLELFDDTVPKGEGIYARIIFGLRNCDWRTFTEGTVSWQRTKKSLEELPDGSPWVENLRAFFACMAKDESYGRPIMEKIGAAPYYMAWDTRGFFTYDFCRNVMRLPRIQDTSDSVEFRYLKILSARGNEWANKELEQNVQAGNIGFPKQ